MQNDIYKCINISNVVNKLNIRKTNQIGNNLYLICPFCQNNNETKGYMKADLLRNVFVCNKCEQAGTSIELYAKLKYLTTKDAFKQLLEETPVLDDIPYVFNNPVKGEDYRDMVYNNFLELQKLKPNDNKKLADINFTEEYIQQHKFKSIENDDKKKKEICNSLIEKGMKLDGIPGFCATCS